MTAITIIATRIITTATAGDHANAGCHPERVRPDSSIRARTRALK